MIIVWPMHDHYLIKNVTLQCSAASPVLRAEWGSLFMLRAEWGSVYVYHIANACFLMPSRFRTEFPCLPSVGGKSSPLDCWALFCFEILYFRCSGLLCLLQIYRRYCCTFLLKEALLVLTKITYCNIHTTNKTKKARGQ